MNVIKRTKRKLKKIYSDIVGSKTPKPEEVKVENEAVEVEVDETELELNAAVLRYKDMERDKVWVFFAGQASDDFRGNPKYLFVYINRYRPDIAAYWLCISDETTAQIRDLGFTAYKLDSPAAQYAINHTGVVVAEQIKAYLPEGLENVKYLNLWHGIGVKRIERKLFLGDISMGIARKYVDRGTFYRDHQLMVVTSPTSEKENNLDCGVDTDKFVRTGYLRCEYQQNFEPIKSFEHDLRKVKGLPADARMIVYAPTYRAKLTGTFSKAIEDIEALYQCCERNNLLLIFKLHPNMETDEGFIRAWETYGDRPRFWFWDNKDDFYEIMDQMDMAIIDYSAIFSDMVAVGIKHYIRYIFDFDDYMQDGFTLEDEYYERTAGKICRNFDELIDAINTYQERDDSEEFQRINDKLWSYAGGKDDFEKTIKQVLDFEVVERDFPNLYSFDIFDTLISRKVLDPVGVFYGVREKMIADGGFSLNLIQHYPEIRHAAEFNVREYYNKTQSLRKSERVEISFVEIFDRMAEVYNLTEEQKDKLMQWELELEIDNVIPLENQINLVKELLAKGEKVVLISDMYLPKEFITKMLEKADPILAELPLFLSSDYGVLKTSQKLFFEVYKSFEPYYDFKKWIHYGDNVKADQTQARGFKICTRRIARPEFDDVQTDMVKYLSTYDGYKVAAVQARLYHDAIYQRDEFVASYVVLLMVPYVDWAIRDAVRRGYKTLYFISRDGHHLKRIADAIIKTRGLDIRTKYIYASRRAWRVPSFITEVDEGFWEPYGSFADLISKEKLFKAMNLDEETFRRFFPAIDPDVIDFENQEEINSLTEIFRDSKEYNDYLLQVAAEERVLVSGYLKQEMDFDEKFAVVEYYGRGYTQDTMVKLCQDIVGQEIDVPFYYSRSVLPTMGSSVRYNFTTNTTKQYFIECIFANMPYRSVESYEMKDGRIEPVIVPLQCDANLFDAMERILPEFAASYAALDLDHPEDTDRALYDFALDYYKDNLTNDAFIENISTLKDSVALYGKKREYAPPYTMENLEQFANKTYGRGAGVITTSITMSVMRSSDEVRDRYCEMYQIMPGDNLAGGRLLTDEEMESNSSFRQKYEKLQTVSEEYRELYEQACASHPVQNKVLFITNGKTLANTSLELVRARMMEQEDIEVSTIYMGKTKMKAEEVALEVATAKYIVAPHPVAVLCKIDFRPETREIMLNSTAFPLYNQMLDANYFLKWRRKYVKLSGRNDISVLQVPSKRLEKRFRKNYSRNTRTDCSLYGCCNTDMYFDDAVRAEAREELIACFPEAADKKVILYMPTVRTRKSCPEWLLIPDMEVLQQLIGDEYVVVLNFNTAQFKGKYGNVLEVPGFSKMINKGILIRKLMLAADVLVGDYRDTFFEAAFMDKPTYFTVSDYEEMIKSNNMGVANEFESYIYGPVVTTADDLARELKDVENYDYTRMRRFKEEMFAGCDGHSVDRVVELLKG